MLNFSKILGSSHSGFVPGFICFDRIAVANGHSFAIAKMAEGYSVAWLRGDDLYWLVTELATGLLYFGHLDGSLPSGFAVPGYTADRIDNVVADLGADMGRLLQ